MIRFFITLMVAFIIDVITVISMKQVPWTELRMATPPSGDLLFQYSNIIAFQTEPIPLTVADTYKVSSQIMCLSVVMQKEANAYYYKDRDCSLIKTGVGRPYKSNTYNFIKPFPFADSLEEVAQGKSVHCPSFLWGYTCEKMVDGSITEFYETNFGTPKGWGLVDIGETRLIHQILIYPRLGYDARWHHIEVRIGNTLKTDGDFSSYTLVYYHDEIPEYHGNYGYIVYTSIPGIEGRYLSVQYIDTVPEQFHIADISIFANKY